MRAAAPPPRRRATRRRSRAARGLAVQWDKVESFYASTLLSLDEQLEVLVPQLTRVKAKTKHERQSLERACTDVYRELQAAAAPSRRRSLPP